MREYLMIATRIFEQALLNGNSFGKMDALNRVKHLLLCDFTRVGRGTLWSIFALALTAYSFCFSRHFSKAITAFSSNVAFSVIFSSFSSFSSFTAYSGIIVYFCSFLSLMNKIFPPPVHLPQWMRPRGREASTAGHLHEITGSSVKSVKGQ